MAKLIDVAGYLAKNYPNSTELTKARITKMIYLADWKSAIETGHQITDIQWLYNHYGPYVEDVMEEISKDKRFSIHETVNFYGSNKYVVQINKAFEFSSLSIQDMKILDFVIEKCASKNWNDFIKLVYSTYPVFSMDKYSTLDLVKLAKEYKEIRELI